MSLDIVTFKSAPIEIIDGDRGKNYPKQDEFTDDGYCLFLNAKNVTEDGFNFDTKMFISEERDNLLKKGKLQKGDVILTTRGTVGNVAFYSNHIPFDNIRINSGMLILRSKQELDSEFLYWTLKSNYFQKQIYTFQSGTAQPQLPISSLNHMEFYLPSFDIQKKIVKILSQIDEKIRISREINKNLFSIGRLIFKEYILKEYNNSHTNWSLVPFSEISTVQNGFAFKSNDYCDVGCKMIRTKDITSSGFVSNDDLINLPESFYESKKYNNYKFERLDTITVMVGASIGKMGLITDINIPSLQNQNMWRFRSKLKDISPAFVYYYVEKINKEIINMATGSARSFYRKNLFLDYECIMPSNDYLNTINPIFNSVFDKISENVVEIEKLKQLRDVLLPKLMSGEIDVSKINCDMIKFILKNFTSPIKNNLIKVIV